MIPVYQTITNVSPELGRVGNCFQACIASILELPLDDVPNVVQLDLDQEVARGVPLAEAWKTGTGWWHLLNDWLEPRGLYYYEFLNADKWGKDLADRLGYHVMIGGSPRGDFDHAVVGFRGEMVHDPREDADPRGLTSLRAFGLFIPFDPSGRRLKP